LEPEKSVENMAQRLSNIDVVREFETRVPAFPRVSRFITIVGFMSEAPVAGGEAYAETYTCLVGPVLQEYEFLGASCLPSIARLETSTLDVAQCVIESSEAEWDEESGRVELRVQVAAAGAACKLQILFSVTILAEM
jgi:hypothetical protein